MTIAAEAPRVLEAAAGRVEAAWLRGAEGPRSGPNCILGAIRWEAQALTETEYHGRDARWHACKLAQRAVQWADEEVRKLGLDITDHPRMFRQPDVTDFNDRHCPDAHTAAELLRRAAKEAANAC